MASLTILPNELIRGIFSNLAAFELATDQRVCRRWKRIGSEALLWRRLCMADYRFWDEESAIKEKLQQTASTVDWDAIYAGRVRLDRRVDEQLELIIAQSRGRMRGVEDLAELGYNTKDRLLRHADAALHTEDYLARR